MSIHKFEGDILKSYADNRYNARRIKDIKEVEIQEIVYWDEGFKGWMTKGNEPIGYLPNTFWKEAKIIGNIYENKELLK